MANFIISELAKKDITDIWNYTASEWSEEQAIRYYNGLLDTCERIASNPEIIGRSYDEVRPNLRGVNCGRHIIFYRIISQLRGISTGNHSCLSCIQAYIEPIVQ